MTDTLVQCAAAFAASVAAGAINSVAGGGTLISFSTLTIGLGIDSKIANATNTMGLWPASLAGAWGFKKFKPPPGRLLLYFALVSLAGGIAGAILLLLTPTKQFDAIVPWLILMAALLFVFQERIARRFAPPPELPPGVEPPEPGTSPLALLYQFFVGVYGGYFGAGIGIMMLAALGMLNLGDIYRLNYLKNIGALLINVIAAFIFALQSGMVNWPVALSMAVGGIVGALVMSGIARRIGPKALRAIVSLVGFSIAGAMLYRQLR